jgi:exopolyphosphatase / guanosine-5'-triphosphate,3'-diphosphate pyrophosphatase
MIISVIDIGTNTVLLLVAKVSPDGTLAPLLYEQRIPRLGEAVDEHRTLRPDSMARVIKVLKEYGELSAPLRPEGTVVCGTSAVRDAANREEFVGLVAKETGYRLEVLSGEEEALWTYRGGISGVTGIERATVIDIGGGSTEIIVGDRSRIMKKISLDVGSVRLTERYFRHDPPAPGELHAALQAVSTALGQANFPFAGSMLVGVAGTATTLAILDQGLRTFDVRAVTNYRLTLEAVDRLCAKLREMDTPGIQALSSAMEGRADVIVAGTLILREAMKKFGFNEAVVSERGLRYGLALREAEKHL